MTRGPARIHVLLAALLAVVATLGVAFASLTRGVPLPAAAAPAVVLTAHDAYRGAQSTADRPDGDRYSTVIETEGDALDDDDSDHRSTAFRVAGEPAAFVARVWHPSTPKWAHRGHPPIGTSRFAVGRGLLRGPPV